MRISDWSSDVCSSDLRRILPLFDVASGGVLDPLFFALAGDASALDRGFRVVLLRDPADPVRTPAALGFLCRSDERIEAGGAIVAGPILIFARRGRIDDPGDKIGRAHV